MNIIYIYIYIYFFFFSEYRPNIPIYLSMFRWTFLISTYQFFSLYIYSYSLISTHVFFYLYIYPSIRPSIYLFIDPDIYLSIRSSVNASIHPSTLVSFLSSNMPLIINSPYRSTSSPTRQSAASHLWTASSFT